MSLDQVDVDFIEFRYSFSSEIMTHTSVSLSRLGINMDF